jgi:hypothetical protein
VDKGRRGRGNGQKEDKRYIKKSLIEKFERI